MNLEKLQERLDYEESRFQHRACRMEKMTLFVLLAALALAIGIALWMP